VISQEELAAPPDAPEPTPSGGSPAHFAGTIVRLVILVILALIVVPAVIANGDHFAAPGPTLVILAEIAVIVATMVYWLATVGMPSQWLTRRLRLTPDRFLIAAGSITAVFAVLALAWFHGQLTHQRSPLAQFDLRAIASAQRLVAQHDLMEKLNRYGQKGMLAIPFMLVIAAVVTGAFRSAVLLASTCFISIFLLEVLKVAPAPPLNSLGQQTFYNTQWPSGHASIQGAVALGMVLWWWGAGLPRPSLVAAVAVPVATLTGYSRAFLGIHLLSEVLSGWVVAMLSASVVLVADRLIRPRLPVHGPRRPWLVVVAAVAALAFSAFAVSSLHLGRGPGFGFGGHHGPPHGADNGPPRDFPSFIDTSQPLRPTQLASSSPAAVAAPVPRFSDTLLGGHVMPVGLVVIANAAPFRAAFEHAGWVNQKLSAASTTFVDSRAPDAVVTRTTTSPAEKHVAQVWELPLHAPNGCPVWAVTVAQDAGKKISWPSLAAEQHIESNVDSERDSLAKELTLSGFVDLGRVQAGKAVHGSGAAGSFVTDGKVAVIRQFDCG
jgi:membrane-associated phospholipid phosphatase